MEDETPSDSETTTSIEEKFGSEVSRERTVELNMYGILQAVDSLPASNLPDLFDEADSDTILTVAREVESFKDSLAADDVDTNEGAIKDLSYKSAKLEQLANDK